MPRPGGRDRPFIQLTHLSANHERRRAGMPLPLPLPLPLHLDCDCVDDPHGRLSAVPEPRGGDARRLIEVLARHEIARQLWGERQGHGGGGCCMGEGQVVIYG